jgi:hypothetical protein
MPILISGFTGNLDELYLAGIIIMKSFLKKNFFYEYLFIFINVLYNLVTYSKNQRILNFYCYQL